MFKALILSLAACGLLVTNLASAQTVTDNQNLDPAVKYVKYTESNGDVLKLRRISNERVVDASPSEVWESLANYANVHNILTTIVDSDITSEDRDLGMGCVRYCDLDFAGKDVWVEEEIITYVEGSHYRYDVVDWENFPLAKMLVTFGVKTNDMGQTVVYNIVDFRLKPAIMGKMMAGQLKNSTLSSVLAYKHYTETGEGNLDPEELFARYE